MQKTAYELRISDWSSDVCSSDLKVRVGQRLKRDTRRVSRDAVTDGPFSESKEVIGGYWHVLAASLDEAVAIMAHSPTLACGLEVEIRPIEPERADARGVGKIGRAHVWTPATNEQYVRRLLIE